MICANVLPRQHTRIPWGWKNETIDSLISGKETYVVEPKGDLGMPDLVSYFDWSTYIVEGFPVAAPLGTRNYKSIFTTATRLLGFERLLIERPNLSPITEVYLEWNANLIARWGGSLDIFFLGDDIAGNQGLFMHPDVWRDWLKPHYREMFREARWMFHIFHSDGDIYDILDDLQEIGADAVSYEPVGRMKDMGKYYGKMKMVLVEDQAQQHTYSMALQR